MYTISKIFRLSIILINVIIIINILQGNVGISSLYLCVFLMILSELKFLDLKKIYNDMIGYYFLLSIGIYLYFNNIERTSIVLFNIILLILIVRREIIFLEKRLVKMILFFYSLSLLLFLLNLIFHFFVLFHFFNVNTNIRSDFNNLMINTLILSNIPLLAKNYLVIKNKKVLIK